MNWIKCSDIKPPKDGSAFLGYDDSKEELGKIYVLVYIPEKKYPAGEFFKLSRDACYQEASGEGYFTWNPSHWMPAPKPPKD